MEIVTWGDVWGGSGAAYAKPCGRPVCERWAEKRPYMGAKQRILYFCEEHSWAKRVSMAVRTKLQQFLDSGPDAEHRAKLRKLWSIVKVTPDGRTKR